MELSSISPGGVAPVTQVSEVMDEAQALLLKKAIFTQAESALTLLQALPANLPLETSGTLGTQLNMLV